MPARRNPRNDPVRRAERLAAATLRYRLRAAASPAPAPDLYRSDPGRRLARWRARCGPHTVAQVRAWVLRALAELPAPLFPPTGAPTP